jgi:aminopeptidase N
LKTQYDTQIASIATWFGQQQQSLREMKASAALQKSQSALTIALQAIQTAKTEAANKRSVLEQWVVNNSTNIKQLASNWQALTGATLATPSTLDISPGISTTTNPFVSQTLPGEKKRVSLWGNVVPGYSNFG